MSPRPKGVVCIFHLLMHVGKKDTWTDCERKTLGIELLLVRKSLSQSENWRHGDFLRYRHSSSRVSPNSTRAARRYPARSAILSQLRIPNYSFDKNPKFGPRI